MKSISQKDERQPNPGALRRAGRTAPWAAAMSLLLLFSIAPATVLGQDTTGFEVQRFHPATSQRMNYFTVESGESIPGGGWEVGLMANFSNDLFVAKRNDERIFSVLSNQLGLSLLGAYAPVQNLQFSIDLPFYLYQSGGEGGILGGPDAIETGGIGDIRVTPKWTFVHSRGPGRGGIDAALLAIFSIPTGDPAAFQGEDFRAEPRVAADYVTASGFGLGLNIGFLIRKGQEISNIEVANQLTYGLGLRIPLVGEVLTGIAEFYGALTVGADDVGSEEDPAEVLVGGRLKFGDFYINLGGGTGVIQGYGAPDWRVFLGLAYSTGEEEADRDRDGYLDDEDGCPDEPEDFDGFEDEDGCPDPDNDQDTILDVDDDCPNEAEDFDGWADEDGCPDPDNDGDGYLDADDGCPNEPEDFDGFEDEDGCPDPDNDGDGVPDVDDECPMVPEDLDEFEDEDGCPEEGPAIERPTIIEITQQIQFDYDSARIRPESNPILNAVARILNENPQILLVRVEGHTSTEGEADHNMDLSIRRANAVVDALVERGVDRSRLVAQGFGETRPLEPDETQPGARELNRRVEFHIVERAE